MMVLAAPRMLCIFRNKETVRKNNSLQVVEKRHEVEIAAGIPVPRLFFRMNRLNLFIEILSVETKKISEIAVWELHIVNKTQINRHK